MSRNKKPSPIKTTTLRRFILREFDSEDIEASVRGCLADLRHLCDSEGIDFSEQDRIGRDNYLAEVAEYSLSNQ